MARERILTLRRMSQESRSLMSTPEHVHHLSTDEKNPNAIHVQLSLPDYSSRDIAQSEGCDDDDGKEEERTAVSHDQAAPVDRIYQRARYQKVLVDDRDDDSRNQLDMGQFMDQVSQLSIQIDLIQSQLDAPREGFSRSALLDTIRSQLCVRLGDLQVKRAPLQPDSALNSPAIWPVERTIRSAQVSGLRLRLGEMVDRLRRMAGEERDRVKQEIGVEWKGHLAGAEEGVDGLVALGAVEATRRLSRAVRDSRRYPEARQAALAIEVQLERLGQLEGEIEQSDRLIKWLIEDTKDRAGSERFITINMDQSSASLSLNDFDNFEQPRAGQKVEQAQQNSKATTTVSKRLGLSGVSVVVLIIPIILLAGTAVALYMVIDRRK